MSPDTAPLKDYVRFVDSAGEVWIVNEVPCVGVPGARADRCLVFESRLAVRRVWTYPTAWRDLDPSGLERLSWHR